MVKYFVVEMNKQFNIENSTLLELKRPFCINSWSFRVTDVLHVLL